MNCKHERLRTVGDRVFCCVCKAELPLEFLMAKNKPVKAEKQANNPPVDEKPSKSPSKKTDGEKSLLKRSYAYGQRIGRFRL